MVSKNTTVPEMFWGDDRLEDALQLASGQTT
jgi:hypothetical protein